MKILKPIFLQSNCNTPVQMSDLVWVPNIAPQ